MKVSELILILGWISLFSTLVFLFNDYIVYKCDVQAVKISKAVDSALSHSLPPTTSQPENLNCKRMNLKLADPQRSIVASFGNGRLGNQMANFASCYAIMKDYGMYHYLNSMQLEILKKAFVLPELVDADNAPYYVWEKGKYTQ